MVDTRSGNLILKFESELPDDLKGKIQVGINQNKLIVNIALANEAEMEKRKEYYLMIKKWISFLDKSEDYLSDTTFYQIGFTKPKSEILDKTSSKEVLEEEVRPAEL